MTATIKSVVGGKSTMQNELIGDIQAEFGDAFKVCGKGSWLSFTINKPIYFRT